MKTLNKTLLVFAILLFTFSNTKAQDDANCGIVINDVLTDSVTCWNAKEFFLVFPINPDWLKYDKIEIGLMTVYPNGLKQFLYTPLTKKEFEDNLSKGQLGLIKITNGKQLYSNLTNRPIVSSLNIWSTFEKESKKDPNVQTSKQTIQIKGYYITGNNKIYSGNVEVNDPVYSKETILWKSKTTAAATYAINGKGKLIDESLASNVFNQGSPVGSCSNAGKPFTLKKEDVNYGDKYFIIKK